MTIFDLWAKSNPFQSVVTHGTVSGVIAQQLSSTFLSDGTREQLCRGLHLPEGKLAPFIGYFASLHDIGKIHYNFQAMQEETKCRLQESGLAMMDFPNLQFRHERETVRALRRIWKPIDRKSGSKLADILGAHHQGKHRSLAQPEANAAWIELQMQYEKKMRTRFWNEIMALPELDKKSESVLSAILLGLVILSDWIASGDCFDHAEDQEDLMEYAEQQAAHFLQISGLNQPQIDGGETFYQVWPNIPNGCARELQQKTEELFQAHPQNRYSLVLLEAPMGEGKTEAGVYAALQMARQWGKRGFYIALPTSATANQMVGRMRSLLQMHDTAGRVMLLHAMAWMVDDCTSAVQKYETEDARFAANWLMPLRRGMLSAYAVGTVDQVMMAAMFIRYGVLRLLGLSGKVLVIDEIHAYDTYMQNILEGLLAWCRALEVPVVMLSATLPPEKKQRLLKVYTDEEMPLSYPSITAVKQSGEVLAIPVNHVAMSQTYQVELLPILHKPDKIAVEAVKRVQHGGCLCILLNTVAQAQETYVAIQKSGYHGTLVLFHARFPAERRDALEKQCVRFFGKDHQLRPSQAILVATQVVEQSLDVDFDAMFCAVSPMDLLLQRMGREYRHAATPRPDPCGPVFTVLVPEDGQFQSDGAVYPECMLRQTIHLLQNRDSIQVPECVAELVSDAYDSSKLPPQELNAWMENLISSELQGATAEQYKLWGPEKRFRPLVEAAEFDDLEQQSYLSARTRLAAPAVRIALLEPDFLECLQNRCDKGILPVKDTDTAQRILKRSVSISEKIWDHLSKKYNLWYITGGNLIAGIKILPLDNPGIADHPELGVIWREELK